MTTIEVYELVVPFALLLFIGVPGLIYANWSQKHLHRQIEQEYAERADHRR